ncbi:MAG: hypothetical protein HRF50_04365 [Phycisphaerae bacterium]|jgi:hypothetical protein
MAEEQERALYIAYWHDQVRGFEGRDPRSRNGPPSGPLSWYRANVHTGRKRRALFERFGEPAGRAMIGYYDHICQLSTAQPIARRGYLINQFGTPYRLEQLPLALECLKESEEFARDCIENLIAAGWLVWRPWPPDATSAREIPRSRASDGEAGPGVPDATSAREIPRSRASNQQRVNRAYVAREQRVNRAYQEAEAEAEAAEGEGELEAEADARARARADPAATQGPAAAAFQFGFETAASASESAQSGAALPDDDLRARRRIGLLRLVGFSERQATRLLSEHDVALETIQTYVEWAAAKEWAKTLHSSPGAFVRRAIEFRYTSPPAELERYRAARSRGRGSGGFT